MEQIKYTIVDDNENCSICMNPHEDNFTRLTCNHQIHTPCYEHMVLISTDGTINCPVCRAVHVHDHTIVRKNRCVNHAIYVMLLFSCVASSFATYTLLNTGIRYGLVDKSITTHATFVNATIHDVVYTGLDQIQYDYTIDSTYYNITLTSSMLSDMDIFCDVPYAPKECTPYIKTRIDFATYDKVNNITPNTTGIYYQFTKYQMLVSPETYNMLLHSTHSKLAPVVIVSFVVGTFMMMLLVINIMRFVKRIRAHN